MNPVFQQMTQGIISAKTVNSGTCVHLQYIGKLMSVVS